MKSYFRNLSVRKKIILVFTIPITVLSTALLLLLRPMVMNEYVERVLYTMNQSEEQAATFLDSYLQTMDYLSQLFVSNGDVLEVLSAEDFGSSDDLAVQYREYLKLRDVMLALELENPMYRFGVYLPDDLFYTANRSSVYPASDLDSMGEKMWQALENNSGWFTTGSEEEKSNTDNTYETLVVYRYLKVDGENRYVAKVSSDIDNFRTVLKNAGTTKNSVACVIDGTGKILFASGGTGIFSGIGREQLLELAVKEEADRVSLQGTRYRAMASDLSWQDLRLITLTPERELRAQSYMVDIFFAFLWVGILLIVLISSRYMSRYITRRLTDLSAKMKELESGDINTNFSLPAKLDQGDEFNEIYYDFNYMTGEVRRLMQEHYRMGKSVMSAELKALQAQINPHFLYNTLDLINWTAMDYGSAEIAELSQNLAKFYRLSLNHGKNILKIREELEHVKSYVEIENFHFEQAIDLALRVPEDLLDYACPNIILQPFVENAIVHGIAEHPEIAECAICITARREGEDILFTVSDDGLGIPTDVLKTLLPNDMREDSRGYGVKNINFRLKLYYGDRYGVRYESGVGEGTTVYIRIPALTVEETEQKMNL